MNEDETFLLKKLWAGRVNSWKQPRPIWVVNDFHESEADADIQAARQWYIM